MVSLLVKVEGRIQSPCFIHSTNLPLNIVRETIFGKGGNEFKVYRV